MYSIKITALTCQEKCCQSIVARPVEAKKLRRSKALELNPINLKECQTDTNLKNEGGALWLKNMTALF